MSRAAKRPKVAHYFHPDQLAGVAPATGVAPETPEVTKSLSPVPPGTGASNLAPGEVQFLCGEWGSLAYHGVGQHRPLPTKGRMVLIEDNGDCKVCQAVYDGRAECTAWDCQDQHRAGHRGALRLRGYAALARAVAVAR